MGSGLGSAAISDGGGVWEDLGGMAICDELGERAYESFRCLKKNFIVNCKSSCVPSHALFEPRGLLIAFEPSSLLSKNAFGSEQPQTT